MLRGQPQILFLVLLLLISCPSAKADGWLPTLEQAAATPFSIIGICGLIGLSVALYFLPSFIAFKKEKDNLVAIAVLNFFLGWTFIGWLGALLWALTNNGTRKTNKEVAPGVFAGYVATFFLTFVPLSLSLALYGKSVQDKAEEEKRATAAKLAEEEKEDAGAPEIQLKPGAIYESDLGILQINDDGSTITEFAPGGINASLTYQYDMLGNNRMWIWTTNQDRSAGRSYRIRPDRIIAGSVVYRLKYKEPAVKTSYTQPFQASSRFSADSPQPLAFPNLQDSRTDDEGDRIKDSQIKNLEKQRAEEQEKVRNLAKLLQDRERISDEQSQTIKRLQNNLAVYDETMRERNTQYDQLLKQKERSFFESKKDAIADRQATMPVITETEVDVRWPNFNDFSPIDYRRDVYKRLKHNAERHLLGCIDTVCIKFAIQKDGTPTAITIKGESLDEESRKNCRKFIETAGPFRPLWPQNMHEMNVETVLNQLQNESIIVQSLQIESVGNKL